VRLSQRCGTGRQRGGIAVILFVCGTLKRGFPLHDRGLAGAPFIGRAVTAEPRPLVIAGPWYAPMLLDEPGRGLRVEGELFEVDSERLRHLDGLESVVQPGNFRIGIDVVPEGSGAVLRAFAYPKGRELATPLHSGCMSVYTDRRFVAPEDRPGNRP
jgi:gamma-glutamylaminecyclotransferase